jgi:hypothetical protein
MAGFGVATEACSKALRQFICYSNSGIVPCESATRYCLSSERERTSFCAAVFQDNESASRASSTNLSCVPKCFRKRTASRRTPLPQSLYVWRPVQDPASEPGRPAVFARHDGTDSENF